MGRIKGWLKRLERAARGEMIAIPQRDGTVVRFPEGELAPAFLDAFDRAVGRADPAEPEHPLCAAARNTFYAAGGEGRVGPIEDLSE